MKYIKPLSAIALAALLFIACKTNKVALSYTNAKGEVATLQNLVFRFDKNLIKDSLLNLWDSTDYVSFSPAVKGRFRWQNPDELVFSPSEPLKPATTYTAKINKTITKFSAYNSVQNGDKIKFNTTPLRLEGSQVTWMGESATTATPQLDLFFNYPVDPATLKDKLQVETDGTEKDVEYITVSAAKRISIRIKGIKQEDKDVDTKITLSQGLKPEGGSDGTTEKTVSSLSIPSPFTLTIQNVESEHDGTEGVVRISTSQQVSMETLKSMTKVDPSLTFTVQPDETGFSIHSDKFNQENSYNITLLKGLRGKLGGVLKEDYNSSVAFGQLEANIKFTSGKGVYLSRKGGKNLEVSVTNVPVVKLVISKIYENNLLMAQRYGYYTDEYENGPSYNEDGEVEAGLGEAMLGDVIYTKEIDTRSLPKSAGGRILNLSQFEDRLPDFNGVYHVSVRSKQDYWISDSKFVSMSDLGLIAKEGSDKMMVFVNSIKTAQAVSGVNISVYGNNNQLLGTGATNGEGVAEIAYTQKDFSGFKPAMIIAKTADDFNYLPFQSTAVNTSRFDVGGKRNNTSGLDAFIYAERDIYRPGEKINYSVIVRDKKWNVPGDIPLKLKALLPNGKEIKEFRKSLNEEGSLEGSIELSVAAITGAYTLEVYTSNDVLLGSQSFSVEEFVPDRIRVNTKLDKSSLRTGESTTLQISAANFFGPPAANRNYETEIQIHQKAFSPEKFADYDFTLANQKTFFDKIVKQGQTDANGNASISFEVPTTYVNTGALQAQFYSTVFDETGRPVSCGARADVYTQDVFFGIKQGDFYYYPLNQPVKFNLVAVNKDGNAVSGNASIQVIKHEYRTVLAKSGSTFRYDSQKEDKVMDQKTMAITAGTAYSFVPRSPGDYEVRIAIPGSNTYVMKQFYSYGSWGGDNSSFEVNNEGNIDIELDKTSYYTGEQVKALFKTPFSGKMLVTIETDHVLSHQYVQVDGRTASLNLDMKADYVPNAYITATLIKPHEISDIPLTVAHGFKNIKVEDKGRKIPIEITSPKSVRSKTHQTIKVKASPGSYVTLAAVDNGVLQVTDFQSPNPYDYFYSKKALGVSAFDLYPLLLAEVRARLSSTGGDGGLEMDKRNNPMPAKRVKVVSYWSGIKKANGSGVAEFEFDVPQFSGELRLMAVAYKGNSFGSGVNTITVADPLVLSTALPRFLSPGDTISVPVTITNTTDKATTVTANLSVEGPMQLLNGNNQQVSLQPKSEGVAVFRIAAASDIATGKINVSVKGLGETFNDVTEIGVRPPSTLQKRTSSGSLTSGTQALHLPIGDFINGTSNYKLVVSRSPVLELGDQLQYLIQYPYGCTEQTVSSAFPQLYYSDLTDLMQLKRANTNNANANILEAIRKIKMRQLYNGAVTLWDGEGREDWWTTIYAAHFLMEARKAGFDVENSLLETMLNYINNRLRNKETITYYYNRDQNKKIAPKEVAYSLYVLALAGRSNVPAMNYYKANTNLLALDSRYLLSAAYATAGDKRSFAGMLPAAFAGEESVAQTGGSYYSDVRDEAISLNALIDADPGNKQVPLMAKHVSQKIKSRQYLSTQERAFAFLALGKLARVANNSTANADIKINGKTVGTTSNGQWKGDAASMNGAEVEISTKGNGALYYYWEVEGISKTGAYKEEDSYIKVRKSFYDRNGVAITNNTFKQNDLIIIGISIEKAFSGSIENVVITDLLPAGFEIENPRTKDIPGMEWIKDNAAPSAIDVRDDRIHLFVDLTGGRQKYYYAVRAVSPGTFKMGPVSADAMYNGEYHSYNGAGIISVNR